MTQIASTPAQQRSNIRLGGEVFLVADLLDFPTDACTISLWTEKATRLFYGNYDTGSSFEDTTTFLDVDIQSGGMEVSFAATSFSFSGAAYPAFRKGEAHHLAITLSANTDGYTVSCYVNAVLIGSQVLKIVNGNDQPMRLLNRGLLYIGNRAPDRSQDGQFGDLQEALGAMTELHFYREALTAEAINLDALGEVPENATPYINLPLDDLHHDRRRGLWLDTVEPYYHAREELRTDNNPVISYTPSFSSFPIGDRSVEFWVRCREAASGTLISYGDVSNSDHPNDGGSEWLLQDPASLRLGNYNSGLEIGTGNWNHVAIVEDTAARTTTMYLNGQPGPNPPANYVIDGVITDQPFLLGALRATDANDTVFSGEIAELRIWSRPRTPGEIAQSARGVVPDATDPALVEYWAMGANGIQDDLDSSNQIFVPILRNEVKYPLLSEQATMQVLRVGPNKGGMRTLAYDNLTGIEFSLELWAQTNTDGFLLRGLGANAQVYLSLARAGDKVIFAVSNRTTGQARQFSMDAAGKPLEEWHHLAVTISGTAISGYLDGKEAFAVPITDPASLPEMGAQLRLQFGSFAGAVPAVDGSLAEIRLWNRALSVGEIRHRMYHSLVGNESGIVGRWAFENALGRDSSNSGRHAFPVDQPEFGPLTDIDLEPIGSPYLVAQVSLLEDYHFDDQKITPRNSYRVDVTAYDENDRPLAGLDVSVGIQAEPNNPFQNADLLLEDSGNTESHAIGIGQPYVLTTNALGGISFALEAKDLLAPVLRITSAFMDTDHALLIFPDRQAHHRLAQVTEEELLTKKVVMVAGEEPVAMVSEEQRDSAPHIAQAIRHFMGVATEKAPQSNNPVVRPVEDRLREVVTPPLRRRYENATASPDAYNPRTDVISGYAVVAGQTSISRSLSVNQLPDWEFRQTAAGTFEVVEAPRASRTRSMAETADLEYVDTFTRLLLTSVDGRQRSEPPASYADLVAAIDEINRTRSFWDIFTKIKDAVSFVVQTVEQVFDTIAETIRVAVVYITDAASKVWAIAIHAVEQAVEAVKGVLAKVGATVVGAINFVKELFDWSDILETQKFTEQLLRSTMIVARRDLDKTKIATRAWVEGLKRDTVAWLDQLKSDQAQHKKSIKDEAPPGERKNVKGSYVQNLVASQGKNATVEESTGGRDSNPAQEKLDTLQSENTTKVSQINGSLTNLQLFSDDEFSLQVIVDRLVDLLETIATSLFDLIEAGLDWFFDQLTNILADLDQFLAYHIRIPLVTRLYEEVITDGTQLNLYSLSALLGAIPSTIMYKLATGSDKGPFHGEDQQQYRKLVEVTVATVATVDPSEQAQREHEIRLQKASLGMGGCFLGFIPITTIFNNIVTGMGTTAPVALKRFAHAMNGIFQLTQFPLGSSYKLKTNPGFPPAAMEETIWAVQFFPLALEGISVTNTLNAKQKGFDDFSGIATTVFGGVHVALFISLFALELSDAGTDKGDSAIKFVANLFSCVSELTTLVPNEVYKVMLSVVGNTGWELISLTRYVSEIQAHHQFLAR
jgi:hypothetical protein